MDSKTKIGTTERSPAMMVPSIPDPKYIQLMESRDESTVTPISQLNTKSNNNPWRKWLASTTHLSNKSYSTLSLFLLLSLPIAVETANLRLTGDSFQKKGPPTRNAGDIGKHEQSPSMEWPHLNMPLTPAPSSYYEDEEFYVHVPEEDGYAHHNYEGDLVDDDDMYSDGKGNRDRYAGRRNSTFLISLIVVVSVVAGCGATIIILGYYCQLCC